MFATYSASRRDPGWRLLVRNECSFSLTMRNRSGIIVSMNRLSIEKRAAIVGALVEGNSIRATCRMTGASKNTVTKLLVDLGYACGAHHDRTVRGLTSERIQCDEIWSFC